VRSSFSLVAFSLLHRPFSGHQNCLQRLKFLLSEIKASHSVCESLMHEFLSDIFSVGLALPLLRFSRRCQTHDLPDRPFEPTSCRVIVLLFEAAYFGLKTIFLRQAARSETLAPIDPCHFLIHLPSSSPVVIGVVAAAF